MAGSTDFSDLTFIGRDSIFARRFARPFARFLAVEAAGGILLLIATAAALIWVNSPWGDSYDSFWGVSVDFSINGIEIFDGHTLGQFVNDALMVLFFFVVGLEIKRELVDGQLRNPRDAALPAFAAVGGMLVPASAYLIFNAGGEGQDGWGIPMATDIAFAVGIVSLLGDRISRRLKVFLLSLAIVDDIGAIIVIAVFYSSGISAGWLIASGAIIVGIVVLRQLRVWYIPVYILLGTFLWWTTFRSGVHATIAGVVLGLLTPAKPLQSEDDTRTVARWLRDKPEVFPVDVRYAGFRIRESVSVAERLESSIHPITSFVVIPVFALANAGVRINGDILSAAFRSPVMWGIVVGLVVGKTVGITAFSWVALRLGIAQRPRGMTMRHLVGLAMIAGIGFTVSLFVSSLAFTGDDDPHSGDETALVIELDENGAPSIDGEPVALALAEETDASSPIEDNAKIGILIASAMASVGGLLILSGAGEDDQHDE
ncbi:MAG: Na+/H+ antiporter NhaA [Actinomycetota bacterium]